MGAGADEYCIVIYAKDGSIAEGLFVYAPPPVELKPGYKLCVEDKVVAEWDGTRWIDIRAALEQEE